jgi:hypothetical protein
MMLMSELVNNCIVIAGRALTSTHLSLPFSGKEVQFHSTFGMILTSTRQLEVILSIFVDQREDFS